MLLFLCLHVKFQQKIFTTDIVNQDTQQQCFIEFFFTEKNKMPKSEVF